MTLKVIALDDEDQHAGIVSSDVDFPYVHAHEHPTVVVRLEKGKEVPKGCIALSEAQRLNSRVCDSAEIKFEFLSSAT